MKWGRKQKLSSPSSSPSSSSSILARVLHVSWFSKFKQKSENCKTSSAKYEHGIEPLNFFPTPNSNVRFYSMDEDDPFWRLSFGEERATPARRSTGGFINPNWYGSDREFRFPVSVSERSNSRERKVPRIEAGCRNFSDMVLDIKKMKEMEKKKDKILKDIVNDRQGWMRSSRGFVRAKPSESEIDIFPPVEDEFSNPPVSSNSRKQHDQLEKKKLNAIKLKNAKQKNKVICRIKALEEMKKSRMKMKKDERKEEAEEEEEDRIVFSSFAVVMNSFNPQRDFKDSMVEMISEKGIHRSEDLDELLACYLDLNSNEYHDIIIKVFRKVRLELEGVVQHFDYQARL
ncbi:hypothetical protein OROGR_012678 [Orobanche gracilis]